MTARHSNEVHEGCPTPTAHKRLDEAHRLWHECLSAYQDPAAFRTYLNAAIQALRNVTWVLQKEKRLIDGFDEWYPPWQDRLAADEVMRWVVKSRNRIVKEGDLETESQAIARVIMSYADAASEIADDLGHRDGDADPEGSAGEKVREILAPPRYGLAQVLEMVAAAPIPSRVLRQSTLTIERRWVDRALPDHELLGAMAHAFGVLQQLIDDAHDRIGRPHGLVLSHDEHAPVEAWTLHEGRLPCMVTSRRSRTLALSLDDLQPELGGKAWPARYDPERVAKVRQRYGDIPPPESPAETVLDIVPTFAALAAKILRTDLDHGWSVHYFVGRTRIHAEILEARNNADKRDLAQRVAEVVTLNGVDGVVVVGEAWTSPITLDDEGAYVPPAEHPERREVLMIHAEEAAGGVRAVVLPFERKDGEPASWVGEPVEQDGSEYQFLEPTRAVWRRLGMREGPPT